MKILQVVPGIAPQWGGPSVALTDLTRLLCERGLDAVMMTTNTTPDGRSDVPLGTVVKVRGASILHYNVRPATRYAFSASLARALLGRSSEYDVIHIHWLYAFSSLAAAFAARRAGVPYVFQPNGSLDPNLMRKSRWIKHLYISIFGRYILNGAAAILFTTEAERRLAPAACKQVRSWVIPIGLDWRDYATLPARGLFRSQFPELEGKQVILFLSRINRQKGLDLLVAAFALIAPRHPAAHLLVAGPDGDGYGVEVRRWVAEAGLTHRVTFAGRVPEPLKLSAYVDCDLFVLPSRAENFGAVVTEALACRRPIVISDRVNICDEIAAAGAGVVVACDAESVAGGISRLLQDPAEAEQMAANGRELVQRKFTWEVALDQMIPLYRELAAERLNRS